jgi:hypothetical protein
LIAIGKLQVFNVDYKSLDHVSQKNYRLQKGNMWFCLHQCEALKGQTNPWICKLDFNAWRLDCKPLNKTFN